MDKFRDKYVTVEEAAELANRKASLIRILCREGRFPGAAKMGNAWVIPKEEVEAYRPAKRGVKPRQAKLDAEKAAILEEANLNPKLGAAKQAKDSHRREESA
jgi:excisionase family DNA binding protein